MHNISYISTRMGHIQKIVLILVGAITCSVTIYAGGFQVNLQGTKQLGMGHCGTALKLGSGSIFFNPGAFALLDSNSFTVSANFVVPQINYLAPQPSTYTSSTNASVSTPLPLVPPFDPNQKQGGMQV